MDGQTVRTSLGMIQSNPSAEEAWQTLHDELLDDGGDLDRATALSLLQAARERHAMRGESDAVARLLELTARVELDAERQVDALIELSSVLLSELFAGARAISVLKKAAERAPAQPLVQERLTELLARAENYQEQVRSYLGEAESGNDDEYRSAMLMRSAEVEVCFSTEPSFSKIIENLERALRLDVSNAPASRLLEVIYRRQANWEAVVKVLERSLDRAPSREARVAAGIRLARLYQHHFDDEERAAVAYDKVLAIDPTQLDGMEYVTAYYAKHERWDELVRAYERPLKSGQVSDESRLGEMFQVAMLHWKKRNRLDDADPWFEKIRALQPAHEGVLMFYREYKAQLDDDAGLVQILEAARRQIPDDDPRAQELDTEIESRQSDQTRAQKAIEKCKSQLRNDAGDAQARAQLKVLYKQTQGHNALVELLRQELERTVESDYESRLAILREVAGVYRQYIKSDTALVAVLNQIVHLDGQLDEQDIVEVRELASLYEKLGRPRDFLAAQKLLAEIVPDRDEKIAIYRQLGRRWLEQFSNAQHAMEAFAALQEIAPDDAEALEMLEDLYRKRRAWKDLFVLYEQQLRAQTGLQRVPLLKEMAQLAAERLSRVDEAIGLYREILTIDPTRVDVLDRLEKLAERGKEWGILAEVLEKRLALMNSHDEAQLPVLQKLGSVYGEHLGRQDDANRTWLRVVEVQPANPRAMRVLRDNYLKSSKFDELERLYASQNDLEGLAEVLSTAADRNKDADEKLELSFRAARVYETQLGQAARAIRSYERILTINPKEKGAIISLLPLYEEDEKWVRIPPLLDALLDITDDVDEKVKMYGQLVTIYTSRLGDKKSAYTSAKAAFVLAPGNAATIELLDSAARSAGEWEDMLTVLGERFAALGGVFASAKSESSVSTSASEAPSEGKPKRSKRGRRKGGRQASMVPGAPKAGDSTSAAEVPVLVPEARAVALRIAKVLGEELGRGEDAIARLQDLATSSPHDSAVLAELEKLLRQESRPGDMRWLLNHRQKHASSQAERSAILTEWAVYEEVTLGSVEDALQHFREAVEAQADNTAALESVARLSLALNQPEEAARAIAAHRDLLDEYERAQKDAMLAELLADRLNRPIEALAAARRALDGGAESGAVIPVLRRLVEVPEVRADAARILSEQYEAGGESRLEADAVRALLTETTDSDEQVLLYTKLADIYEEKLKEPGAALTVVFQALQSHQNVMQLWDRASPLAGQAGRPTELADAYRAALRANLDDELVLELSRRAAELHEAVLNDPQGAAPYLEKVLTLVPDDEYSFNRLKEILTAGERWRELEKLYDKEIERQDSNDRKIEMLAEMAMLAEDIIGDAARAIAFHGRILDLDPENAVSLDGMDRLLTRQGKQEELLPLLARRAELSLGEEQHRYLVRSSKIALDLLRPEVAILGVERVLSDDHGNYEARDLAEELLQIESVRVRAAFALESVYETKDEIRDLVRVLGIRVEALRPSVSTALDEAQTQEQEDERRDLLRRIATLRDDRLHDDVGSFDVFAELSPLDPLDADLRARLIDSGRRLGRSEKVVEVLLLGATSSADAALKAEILLQAAVVQADTLDDPVGAERTYREVIGLRVEEPLHALVAAKAVEAMLSGTERYEDLVEILRIQIELDTEHDHKAELVARLAHLQGDVLGQSAEALATWELRLTDDPDDPEALRNLTELYETQARYADVARVLVQRRDAATDAKERVNLARNLADVQERHLDELGAAIDSYQSILDEAGPSYEALFALERLYGKAERWEELADVLLTQAEVVEDEVERLRALTELGNIRANRLEDLPGALEAYRRALSIDIAHQKSREALSALLDHQDKATRLEVAEILHPIYEADGDHFSLIHVLTAEAQSSDDAHYRMERYQSAMNLAEDSLHDLPRAFQFALLGIAEAAPLGEASSWLEALERLAGATSGRKVQVATLNAILVELFNPDEQLLIQRRIAEILRAELDDPSGAIEAYQKALEINPVDHQSLAALESLHVQRQDHGALLDVLGRRIDAAETDAERREVSHRRASLLANIIKDFGAAIAAYEAILDFELDSRAIEQLETLYKQSERYEDLIALIQRRIDSGGEDTVSLRVKMAAILIDKQKETERGLDELETALMDNPQHAGAFQLLESLKDQILDPVFRARAAALLEPIYMVRADFDNVLNVLLLRLEGAQSPEERRELVTRLAQIYEEQKEDYVSALEVTALLLRDDPADELTFGEMERLAKVAGAELRLAELIADLVQSIETDDEPVAQLCWRAGDIFAAHERNEIALSLLRRALAFEAESHALFDGIDALLRKIGTASERVELYRAGLEHRYEPEEQIKLLSVIAELEESQLKNTDAAISAHREIVDLDQSDERSLDALARLYSQAESWPELAELYLARAETNSRGEGVKFRILLADLYMRKLGEHEPALDQLEEVVRQQPDFAPALDRLEAMRKSEALLGRVVDILRPIYEQRDDWRHLISLNEDRFLLAEDPMDQAAVLRETAALWEERGGDKLRAQRAIAEAFRLQPEDDDLRAELERLSVMNEAWSTLTELYAATLVDHPDLPAKAEIVGRLAALYDEKLDDPRAALLRYLELNEIDSTEADTVGHILVLSLLLGDWRVREESLSKMSELTYDEDERIILFSRLGELRERTLEDLPGAMDAYEKAFEIDERNPDICDRLIALYQVKDDPERLVELYLSRVEGGHADFEQQFELLSSAAKILISRLKEPRRAIECLTRALLAKPNDTQTLVALNTLYRSEEMWPELLDNLRLEAGTAGSASERVKVRHQIAHILAEKMQSYEEALEAYGVILDERPDDELALDAVFLLVDREDHLCRAAAELLVPALRQTKLRDRLVKALRLRLTDEHEPVARVETLRSIAQVYEEDLNQPAAAMDSLLEAVTELPDAEDLYEDVERLAAITGDFSRYAQVLTQRAAEVFDSELSHRLWVRAAKVFESKLKDHQRAIDAYEAAAEQTGDRLDLLDALDRLYTQLDDTASVVKLLERRMGLVETDQDQARLLCRQGQLQLDKQNALPEAMASLRQALELDLHNKEASELLERILKDQTLFDEVFEILDSVYRDRSAGAQLAALHEQRVARADSGAERTNMRRSLAQVLEDECNDPLAAQRVMQQALQDDLKDEGLRDELERLLAITGKWTEGADSLLLALGQEDVEEQTGVRIAQRAADWFKDRALEPEAAERALQKALKYQPENDEILEQLEGLQSSDGQEERLLTTLKSRANLALDEGSKIEFLRRVAQLARVVNKPEQGELALRQILEIDDQDEEALRGLCAARNEAEDYAETYTLLLRRIDLESDPERANDLKFEAAVMASQKLDKSSEAILLFEELLHENAQDAQVIDALQNAYAEAERYDDLGDLITTQLSSTTDPLVIGPLKLGLARLKKEQFGDDEGAIELLKEVFELDPNRTEAADFLASIYESLNRYEPLVQLYARQRSLAIEQGDEARNLELLRFIAKISETQLADLDGAIKCVSEIRSLENSPENAEELLRLLLRAEKLTLAAAVLEEICGALHGEQVLLRRDELAELYRSMGDIEGVIRTVEGSYALAPFDLNLKTTLQNEYVAAAQWQKLADMVLRDAEAVDSAPQKLDLYREAADIHTKKRKDPESAIAILEKAAELAPENRAVLLELCDAYSSGGRGGEAAAVLEKIVESYAGKRSKELGEIHRRLATAYLSNNEHEKAQGELDKAFRIEPGNIEVLKQLAEVAMSTGDMKKAQQMFRALLLQRLDEKSPISKAEVFLRLGEVHQKLGEAAKAKQMYERALQTDASLVEAQTRLESL